MGFLGVYKAVYDYAPQSEGELSISEGDTLFVLEKSGEDDWWKAKKKASGEDDDEPVGLIPNNYIEEAHPTAQARALYDYERQTDEELSFTENAHLEVFDTSDPDWILVGLDGEYGFAPANYIELGEGQEEPATEEEAPPPSLPRRPVVQEEPEEREPEPVSPVSPVAGPAASLANILNQRKTSAPPRAPVPQYTPEASDDDEPAPSLPARPISQASPELTKEVSRSPSPPAGIQASPPYNRTSFHRGIDDEVAAHAPGGFHLYNINEMVSVMGKRKKMPTTFGINISTGVIMISPEKSRDGPEQKWTAEKMTHYSIEGKHVFIELVRPSKSVDFHAGAKDTAQEIVAALGELAGAVRAEGLLEVIKAGSGQGQKRGQVLYDFMAQSDDEVTVGVGDEVIVLDDSNEEWWQVRRLKNGKEGVVPSSYVEITGTITTAPSSSTSINAGRSTIEQNRLEEERLAKESIRAARREEERGSTEVGPGMRLPERGSSLTTRESTGSNSHDQQKSRTREKDSGQSKSSKTKPDASKVRTWTDRSKSFSVEAQFLALKDGKINLHKMNGVKIAVPVAKMSMEDLEYVEHITGLSLEDDKPLADIKKRRSQQPAARRNREPEPRPKAGVSIEQPPGKPEYDWFQFFLSCDVAVGLCERYAQAFNRDSMDESVLPDIEAPVLRTLGIREGDIIKVMRSLDKKYGRVGVKRNVSFGGDESTTPDGESSGGLFSGPGGTLRNNTRKGRPAPAQQTNDTIDAQAFSQDGEKKPLSVATPLASAPTPVSKDVARSGFDDDAWDVKPSKTSSAPSTPATQAPPPAAVAPALTGAMGDLSLLSQPLEPIKVQPTAPQISQPPQPQPVTPSIFAGIGNQQTGLPQQQTGASNQFNNSQMNTGLNIARQRPAPPQQFPTQQGSLMIPAPPNRPLSAPTANQQSSFPLPPLQPQMTGFQNSSGYQPQIAPPGQSLNDLRMQQQYTGYNGPQNGQNMGMMNQPQQMNPQQTGYNNQFNHGMQQPGTQYPMQTGMPQQQQQFMNNGQSPFSDPRPQQFQPLQPQPTGFQSSFPQQQFPQPTGVNSFLPPALQPTPTGMQQQQPQNGFSSSFNPPPVPPIPQQAPMPLVPQKTGPPPPVRFGVAGDTKRLMPQATGRRANLSQATPQNPFGF